jgi:mono/diheme cytochrome c family protein
MIRLTPMAAYQMAGLAAAALLITACAKPAPVPEEVRPPEPTLGVDIPTVRPDGEFENTETEKLGQGRAIAENICSTCHAIGLEGSSPHREAIPFRDLSKNYPIEDLAEPLAEGIMVGHPDMPVFAFDPDHIDSLIAYIESIQTPHEL